MKNTIIGVIFAVERWVCGLLLLLMLAIVSLATFGRYSGWFNLTWGDEAARYTMIWVVFMGAGLSAYRGELFNVDMVVAKLPPAWRRVCICIRVVLVVAFCLFAIRYGLWVVERQMGMRQYSPSMKLPMWFMYASVPLGSFLLMVHYIAFGIRQYRAVGRAEEGGEAP